MKIKIKSFILSLIVLSLTLSGCSNGNDNKKEQKVTENKDNKDNKDEKKDHKEKSDEIPNDKKDDLIKKAHTIIKAIDKRDYKAAAELSNGNLENYLLNNSSDLEKKVLNNIGNIEKIGSSKIIRFVQDGINYIVVFTTAKYQNGEKTVETVFDEQDRLAGLYFR